jgi:predicted nucleic acid-binding protein
VNSKGPRLKIYLDTSVISSLFPIDNRGAISQKAQWKSAFSWRLWANCLAGMYDVCISPTVVSELDGAPEAKRGRMFSEVGRISVEVLENTDAVKRLALEYVKRGVLKERDFADCMHLAFASVYRCDRLVSWNFKHLVNGSTASGANSVNAANRCGEIIVVSPDILLEGEGTG